MEIVGHRIAGLGGTFKAQIWLPGSPDTGIQNYQGFVDHLAFTPRHADIVATKKQHVLSAIYLDDYFTLAMEKTEILVCHEASSCHQYGYRTLAAAANGARVAVVE